MIDRMTLFSELMTGKKDSTKKIFWFGEGGREIYYYQGNRSLVYCGHNILLKDQPKVLWMWFKLNPFFLQLTEQSPRIVTRVTSNLVENFKILKPNVLSKTMFFCFPPWWNPGNRWLYYRDAEGFFQVYC